MHLSESLMVYSTQITQIANLQVFWFKNLGVLSLTMCPALKQPTYQQYCTNFITLTMNLGIKLSGLQFLSSRGIACWNSNAHGLSFTGASGREATSCALSHTELLQKLCNCHKAWDQLNLKEFRVIPSGERLNLFDLIVGTFSVSDRSDLCITWLPSETHNSHTLHHETIGLSIRDFAINSTQDVIAFLKNEPEYVASMLLVVTAQLLSILLSTSVWTFCLHIHTVSSNSPHPLAHKGTLSFDIPTGSAVELKNLSVTLQLAYNMLFLSICHGPCWSRSF